MSSSLSESIQSRNDPISQYLHLKQENQIESSKAEGSIQILADTSRAYFPTQLCSARVRVSQELLDKGCEEVNVEFRGEVHTFAIVSNGQTTYVSSSTDYLFSYFVNVYNSKSQTHNYPTSEISFQPVSNSSQSSEEIPSTFKEWDLTTRLPEKGTMSSRGGNLSVPLPSTFRDSRRSKGNGINYISYGWKVTAEMKGLMKRNKRFWLPILVLPLSYRNQIEDQNGIGRSLAPPVYGEGSENTISRLPKDWSSERSESRIKKGLIFSKGRIEIKLCLPPTSNLCLSNPLPFLLQIKVTSSDIGDLIPTSNSSILPELPLIGPGENHPKFEIRRKNVSRGQSGRFKDHHTTPLEAQWHDGHLEGKGVGVGGIGNESDDNQTSLELKEILNLSSGWSEPIRSTSSTNSIEKKKSPSYPKEKKSLRKNSDDSDDFDSDSDISENEEEKTSFLSKLGFSSKSSKGKGKKILKMKIQIFLFFTTSIISGTFSTFFTPSISSRHLTTSYKLRLRWKSKGLGNDLTLSFREFNLNELTTGIGLKEVYEFGNDAQGLSNLALGWRSSWLKGHQNQESRMVRNQDERLETGFARLEVEGESLPDYSKKI